MSKTLFKPISKRLYFHGFTLIELLIVVLIIAILAAIAVPNFLEFQTRAKVSRTKADMRTIAMGLEAFAVDRGDYPENPPLNEGLYVTPTSLTTPIAYLTTRPTDPFKEKLNLSSITDPSFESEETLYDYYKVVSTPEYFDYSSRSQKELFVVVVDATGALSSVANQRAFEKYGRWMQWSSGPDGVFWVAEDDFNNPENSSAGLKPPSHAPWGYSFDVPYDPTNGTTSFGNIIRTSKSPEGTFPIFN